MRKSNTNAFGYVHIHCYNAVYKRNSKQTNSLRIQFACSLLLLLVEMLQIFYILFVIIFRVFSQDCDYVEIDGICYSVKGPVIQSYQDAECERYGLTFYNPMPEDQDILGSFGTGVSIVKAILHL